MENEKISILRYRGSKLAKIKKIDIFPKIEEPYKRHSSFGGLLSTLLVFIIIKLFIDEVTYYKDSKFTFKFAPDTDFDAKLKINVDIIVAMSCSDIGADILDSTNQNAWQFGKLDMEDTWFEMAPNQRDHFDNQRHLNSYLREEYHSVKDLLWRSGFSTQFGMLPARPEDPDRPYDACRVYGSLVLNKVAGNFHITAGKSLNLPRGHVHISAFMGYRNYNFSHRIMRFSFGDSSPGIIHPLEGDEIISNNEMTLYNYFIEVVPTSVKTFLNTIDTYQYSVKALKRPIDHDKGSHGMPGIYFKYDMSAIKVIVYQERDNLGTLIARLCSIVGGIYVCTGFINNLAQTIFHYLKNKFDYKLNNDIHRETDESLNECKLDSDLL